MAAAAPKYEEFDPKPVTVPDKDHDTILVHVPGFKKRQLRVQLTSTNQIRVSGERETEKLGEFLRFQKDFPLDPNVDVNRISAKLEKDTLYVKLPKKADHQFPTMTSSEMSRGFSKWALYAVLAGLVAVVVGVGLYFTKK